MVPTQVLHIYFSESDERCQETEQKCIAWAWSKGAWHLCYGYCCESWNDDRPFDFTPILDASLSARQECVPHFAELRKKVVEKAKDTIPSLDESIAQLAAALK